MIKCSTCGNEVAKLANVCPHCGHNLYGERVNKIASCCLVPLFVITVLGILSSWECFKVYQYKDNMYLLSQKENKYVQVINDGIQITNPLQAARRIENGLEGATWERFAIVFVDGK